MRPADVTRVRQTARRFRGDLRRRLRRRRPSPPEVVVNATGTWGAPFVPWYPGMNDFQGRHVHTVDYADAAELRGPGRRRRGRRHERDRLPARAGERRRIGHLGRPGAPSSSSRSRSSTSRRGSRAVALQDDAAREGRALPSIVSTTGVPRTRRIQAAIDRGLLAAQPMFASIEPDGVRWADGTLPARGRDHLGDRIPARAAAPRPAEAAREGGRRHRRRWRVVPQRRACSSPATARRPPRSARTAPGARSRARSSRPLSALRC